MSDISIIDPDLDDLLELKAQETFARLNCIQIGKIEAVNSNQTVSIQIQVKRNNLGKLVDYPLLVGCPYFVLQGGGGYLDMPIKVGDYCLILFNDRDIDNWFKNGQISELRSTRKHNLSDGFALVGINPASDFLETDGSIVRLLGTSGPGSEKFAARKDDPVTVTIPANTFVVSVTGGSGAPAAGVLNPAPIDVDGTITDGSSEVKIG